MGRLEEILMPSRFLLTCGAFISSVLAFYNAGTNVAAGYPLGGSASELALGRASLLTALSIAMLCFIVQFAGLLGGFTMFRNSLNVFHCVAHFFGGVLTAWYLIDSWGFLNFWCGRGAARAALPSPPSRCLSASASRRPPLHFSHPPLRLWPRAGGLCCSLTLCRA
jgi:hypothetical protein